MKKILIGIVALLLIASYGYCLEQEQPLQLTIKSDKQVYNSGDKLVFDVVWTNAVAEDIIIFHTSMHDGQNLIIKDESGNRVNISQTVKYRWVIREDSFHTLKPKESYTASISGTIKVAMVNTPYKNMDGAYYILEMKDTMCYLRGGRYTVQYSYTNDRSVYHIPSTGTQVGVDNVWTGTLTSNAITIEVAEKREISKEQALEIALNYLRKQVRANEYIEDSAKVIDYNNEWMVRFKRIHFKTRSPGHGVILVNKKTGKAKWIGLR